MKVLQGHVSPETAYVVADYPYGFRLRCQMRYWIETNNKGQRMMSQTSNPKKSVLVWNKPKASTYSIVRILYLNEENHVVSDGLGIYDADEVKLDAFVKTYGKLGEHEEKMILVLRGHARAQKHITVSIISNPTPDQVAACQANEARVKEMMPRMVAQEIQAIKSETGEKYLY